MNKKTKVLLNIFLTLFGGIFMGAYILQHILTFPLNDKETELYIKTNSKFDVVYNLLLEKNLVKNEKLFFLVSKLKSFPDLIKPGHYIIPSQCNMIDLINLLRSGSQFPVNITFNNIEDIEQLVQKISTQIEEDSTQLYLAFTNEHFIKKNNFSIENIPCMFLPNTYEVYWTNEAKSIREKFLAEYHIFWNDSRIKKAKTIGLSKIDVSILASIVEKETIKKDEMSIVAGLYLNRLNKGWKLQSDPTVIYAIKKDLNRDTIIKRVLFADLEHKSPYNTYKNNGLPPGPICIPSIEAIDAVLNASAHNYMYMCASVERFGYHEFASSSSQHKKNRRKYIAWLNSQKIRR